MEEGMLTLRASIRPAREGSGTPLIVRGSGVVYCATSLLMKVITPRLLCRHTILVGLLTVNPSRLQ